MLGYCLLFVLIITWPGYDNTSDGKLYFVMLKLSHAAKIQTNKVPHPAVFTEMDIAPATVFLWLVLLSILVFFSDLKGKNSTWTLALLINQMEYLKDLFKTIIHDWVNVGLQKTKQNYISFDCVITVITPWCLLVCR